MVGLDPIVLIPLRDMAHRWHQVIDHGRVRRRPIRGDLDRVQPTGQRPGQNGAPLTASRRDDRNTSMTWPNWSTAQ